MLSLEEFRNGDEMVIRLFYDHGKNSYIDRIRTELIGHELGSRDLYYKSCHKLLVHGNIISDESCTACLVTVFMCDSQRHIFLEHLWMSLMFIDWTSSEAMIYRNEWLTQYSALHMRIVQWILLITWSFTVRA